MEFLLNNGANVNQATLGGDTPLIVSIAMEDKEVTEHLRQHGAV